MVERLTRVGVLTPEEGRMLCEDIFKRPFKAIGDDWGVRKPKWGRVAQDRSCPSGGSYRLTSYSNKRTAAHAPTDLAPRCFDHISALKNCSTRCWI